MTRCGFGRQTVLMPMSEPVRFALQDLDLRNRTILDAAIGAAESTVHWARAIHEQGGTSRIIAVDNDLNQMWQDRVHKTLGEYDRYVESHDADIFDLDFIEHGSIDIINCHDTVVFLNDPPLRLIAAFREFDRVLKPAGLLFITSEDPVSLSDDPDNEGQWRRWQFNKTLAALKGENYSSEPPAENVRAVLELLGLEVYDHLAVAPGKWSEGLAEWIGEWREDSLKEIEVLPWPWLKQALRRTADEVHDKVLSDGFCMCPAQYVLKCRKPGAAETG